MDVHEFQAGYLIRGPTEFAAVPKSAGRALEALSILGFASLMLFLLESFVGWLFPETASAGVMDSYIMAGITACGIAAVAGSGVFASALGTRWKWKRSDVFGKEKHQFLFVTSDGEVFQKTETCKAAERDATGFRAEDWARGGKREQRMASEAMVGVRPEMVLIIGE